MSPRINKQFGGIGEEEKQNTQNILNRIVVDKLPPSMINITAHNSEFSNRLSGLYKHVKERIYNSQKDNTINVIIYEDELMFLGGSPDKANDIISIDNIIITDATNVE